MLTRHFRFVDPTQAKEALEKMNGFELAGRPIRVGLGNDKFTPESTQSLLQRFGSQAQAAAHQQGSSFSGMGGRGSHAGGTGNFDRASGRDAEKTGGASALDDTDVAGVNFSNYSRDALMRKLARTEETEEKAAPKATQQAKKVVPADQPAPSRCVLLKNMYNQAEYAGMQHFGTLNMLTGSRETEPNWQRELEEDVRQECEDKYGHVVHIGLGLDNNDGEIYIKFDRVQGGENAIRGLNGRWFGGRMITAQYVVDAVYHMNFPKAANV
jgi:RNA-binding protein 23/39